MRYFTALFLALILGGFTGCSDDGAGEHIEDSVEEAGDAIEDATDE